jgi:hypothetical protein
LDIEGYEDKSYAFQDCINVTTINLPSCTNLGGLIGNDDVFLNITGQTITLTINPDLMTCNGGAPDGDIQYLIDNNDVTINGVHYPIEEEEITNPELLLTFNNISNAMANTLYGWNTYFDLPTNGTAFTSIQIVGNVINLRGDSGIHLKDNLFATTQGKLTHLTDTLGAIITAGQACFTAAYTLCDLPALTTAGVSCFSIYNHSWNFPSLVSVGDWCFSDHFGQNFYLPVCTSLGSTTGDNRVFNNTPSYTMTITIPHALESDGDIVYLKANNTVTIVYSD